MAEDVINLEVTLDGEVRFTTSKVSNVNHLSADRMLEEISKDLGGAVTITPLQGHVHQHQHQHEAQHEHQ